MPETKNLPGKPFSQRRKIISEAKFAMDWIEHALKSKCYPTKTTVEALIVLEQARDLSLTALKFDFVEDCSSETLAP